MCRQTVHLLCPLLVKEAALQQCVWPLGPEQLGSQHLLLPRLWSGSLCETVPMWMPLHLLQGFHALHRPPPPHFHHSLLPRTVWVSYKSAVGFDRICMYVTWRQNADWKDRCLYSKFRLSWYRVGAEEEKAEPCEILLSLRKVSEDHSSWQFKNCLLPWGFLGSQPFRRLWNRLKNQKESPVFVLRFKQG